MTNQIFFGDQKFHNSNTGVCMEKETNKTLGRLEEKVMRREAATETNTVSAKEQGTKGKVILDNARIDQILYSLELSMYSKST